MATFDYNVTGSFIANDPNFDKLSGLIKSTGTISDSDSDPAGSGTFDPGENVSGSPNPTAAGTVEIGGETFLLTGPYPVADNEQYRAYGNVDDPDTFISSNGELDIPFSAYTDESFTVCFAAGTRIATPGGETVVEALRIGDTICTADGGTTTVKWVGRQTVHKIFTPPERFAPVRVKAGALGEGRPHTDLVLTADHALILDGLAINAGALVNGDTIAYEPIETLPDRVTYYHVETEGHEVILANGAPAETYVDYVARRAFDNYAEYRDLYGEERVITEMDLPRVSAARLLPPAIRRRLGVEKAA